MFLLSTMSAAAQETGEFDTRAAQRFASLALACVHKEYPNHISHTLNSDRDVAPPRKLTPAFYGCYDWHSSVHGHWLLIRLVRTFPNAPFVQAAREALRQSLTAENIVQEAAYLRGEGRTSFERPYGLAWLLQLVAELREWDDPQAREMAANLHPLDEAALERDVYKRQVNCQSGDMLAQDQVTAASKEKVLDALGEAASKLRTELGESLATVQKFDVSLEQATTSSLEALKAYSLGVKASHGEGTTAALRYHQRAIALDPNFAMAYWAVGNDYFSLAELGRASDCLLYTSRCV